MSETSLLFNISKVHVPNCRSKDCVVCCIFIFLGFIQDFKENNTTALLPNNFPSNDS